MEKKNAPVNFTEGWGTGGTANPSIATSQKFKQQIIDEHTTVNTGTDKFAINAAKGHVCIPHRWNVQKEALERCGLGHHIKKEIPLIVRESFAKNLGTGCENTHFIQFEGQTNRENFIASHFKKPDNASK